MSLILHGHYSYTYIYNHKCNESIYINIDMFIVEEVCNRNTLGKCSGPMQERLSGRTPI